MTISGSTRVAGVIGDPIAQSRSPAIHNAAFEALGLDWVFLAFPVPAGRGRAAIQSMGVLGIRGLSVTMPHKADAASACDELSTEARTLGVVNAVVLRDDGRTFGTSTDGEGLLRSLRGEGFEPAGRRVLLLGAGGAARAVAHSLGASGAEVTVAARRVEQAEQVAALTTGGRAVALDAAGPLLGGVDAVVNATPLGMGGNGRIDPHLTPGADQWAVDLVYQPRDTMFLADAAERGARTVGGIGMLVHQAAIAFELFTGSGAPLDVMGRAAYPGPEPDPGPGSSP